MTTTDDDALAKALAWAKEQHACADKYAAEITTLRSQLAAMQDAADGLAAALGKFVTVFEKRRESYAKRYGCNLSIGFANFDAMPDSWTMERLIFEMGDFRRASIALATYAETKHG